MGLYDDFPGRCPGLGYHAPLALADVSSATRAERRFAVAGDQRLLSFDLGDHGLLRGEGREGGFAPKQCLQAPWFQRDETGWVVSEEEASEGGPRPAVVPPSGTKAEGPRPFPSRIRWEFSLAPNPCPFAALLSVFSVASL